MVDNKVVLIDGSGYIFRAYYGLPPMNNPENIPVNAVYGFFKMILKLRQDYTKNYMAVVFDHARKTFRNELYPEYKANRGAPPDDLIPQFALVREATRALNLPLIEAENYEADDIIATLAQNASQQNKQVVIISSDKDLMQLVAENISLYDPMKNKTIMSQQVLERFGVLPDKVIDVQALAGDSTDNIPGAVGIGIKTAALLINEYGNLDNLLAQADTIKQPKRRENLIKFREFADISRQLVTLQQNVPNVAEVKFSVMSDILPEIALKFTQKHGFKSLMHYFQTPDGSYGVDYPIGEQGRNLEDWVHIIQPQWICDMTQLQALRVEINKEGMVALHLCLGKTGEIAGIAFVLCHQRRFYLPLGHYRTSDADGNEHEVAGSEKNQGELLAKLLEPERQLQGGQIDKIAALSFCGQIFEDQAIIKIGYNFKKTWHLFASILEVEIVAVADIMLMSFVLDAGKHGHKFQELINFHAEELSAYGREERISDKIDFAALPIEEAIRIATNDCATILRLYQFFLPRLCQQGLYSLYQTMEIPLIQVLFAMECQGILLDAPYLQKLSANFAKQLTQLSAEIFQLTKEEFNIASPKQLGVILFEKMGLPYGRKTKTGQYSTDNDLLDKLVLEGHLIAGLLQNWRHISKLRSTYSESLPLLQAQDLRVHTDFNMVGAQTGRLSSIEPNLQNIPVRDALGKDIRKGFIAPIGKILLSLDYSQIELRLIAHIAGLKSLIDAFKRDEDIHQFTASEVFKVPLDAVTPAQRRDAKAVNFGIIYGISAFGLARQLMISRSQAQDYINAYMVRYPGLKNYMEQTVKQASHDGFVRTLFGRQIHLPAINDKNHAKRNYAMRQAINAPIQGSAADIIKRAMVIIHQKIIDEHLPAKLLLQVHDELIFEVGQAEQEEMSVIFTKIMIEAGGALSVPLIVDSGYGHNWAQAH